MTIYPFKKRYSTTVVYTCNVHLLKIKVQVFVIIKWLMYSLWIVKKTKQTIYTKTFVHTNSTNKTTNFDSERKKVIIILGPTTFEPGIVAAFDHSPLALLVFH